MAAAAWLGACSTLPEDGPDVRSVARQAHGPANVRYSLVAVDYRVTQVIDANPATPMTSLRDATSRAPTDLIGIGDVLAVSLYQPGVGLGSTTPDGPSSGQQSEGTGGQTFPRIVVDSAGEVSLPYAGRVAVVNLTPDEAAGAIRRALRGKVADPQVLVSSVTSARNSVIVIGEVRNAGRFPLGANNDKLLDALAAAGGPTKPAHDLAVTVVRGDQSVSISLATLLEDPKENIRLAPRDQVRIMPAPRKIDVFGAVGKSSQIPIEDDTLSLAGALARIGGLDTTRAAAQSVFVFRFERPEVAKALGVAFPDMPGLSGVPIIYRVDLRDPSGYFLAGKFDVAADDLVYVPTADAAELQKFLTIVNSAAQFFYDAAVAKSL